MKLFEQRFNMIFAIVTPHNAVISIAEAWDAFLNSPPSDRGIERDDYARRYKHFRQWARIILHAK